MLLLALPLRLLAPGFLFSPNDPNNGLFDTWLYAQPDATGVPRYYANYLSACRSASCGLEPFPPYPAAPWNGVGGAASSDGVHFVDQGVLFRKDPKAKWLGSGSVLKNADGEYIMNFSEDYDCGSPNCQSIFFATSRDLKNWTRLPFAPPPADDPNVFKHVNVSGYKVNGRWDCIATIPKRDSPGHFIGYWTASPSAGFAGAGVGETTDLTGYHWKALPPIQLFSAPSTPLELGSVAVLGGRFFMLFGGGRLYVSDDPLAGYKPDPTNFNFLTDGRGISFSRIWNVHEQASGSQSETVLATHQWNDAGCCEWRVCCPQSMPLAPEWNGTGVEYYGTIKQVRLLSDGSPRAVFWPNNELLKGSRIPLGPLARVEAVDRSVAMYNTTALELRSALVVEATLSCKHPQTRAGFVLVGNSSANHSANAFVWDCATQRMSIGPIDLSTGSSRSNFTCGLADDPLQDPGFRLDGHHLCETFDRNLTKVFPRSLSVHLRLLLRSSEDAFSAMSEFYGHDVLSHPYSIILGEGGGHAATLGLIDLSPEPHAQLAVSNVSVWKGTL